MAKNWWEESTLESAAPKNESADEWWSGAKLENAPQRTWGEAIKDTGAQLAEGVNTTLGAIPSFAAPQSKAAGFFRDNAEHWRDQQSDVLKGRIAASDQRIQEAGKDGVLSQIGTAASEYWNDPAQAARLVATNLPSMAATLGTGTAAGLAAKGVAAARGLDAANKAALAAKYGTTTAAATNAALNAGGARGEAFEDLQKAAIAQGMTPEQAEQAGVSGSIMPGVVGGVAGAISGKIGLEKAILGQATTGAAMRKAAGAFGAELTGEQIEELAPKVATNYQVGRIDPGRTLTDDLGRTVVETAIGSGPGAVVAGGASAMRTGETQPLPGAGEPTTSPGADDPNAPAAQSVATPMPAPILDESVLEAAGVRPPAYINTRNMDRMLGDIPMSPTSDLGADSSEADTRTPIERMGINPAAGALSRAAAVAVDSGATPVQFLGATGRDLQARATGPGVTNESNVIDVQGRLVEDRTIGTPRRLTAQESAYESGAQAFRDGAPRAEIVATQNVVARAHQLRGYDDAARQASTPALPAPSNLREGLERIRAQRQEAANAQGATPETAPASAPVPAAGTGAVEAAGVKPAGQRQLSADEQAAQDREEARAKELSLPPVLSARLQEAHKAHGRDVKRSVVERSIANEKANNTGTPKAKRERADRIARLEADLALFDEAAAMPPKEAAGLTENKVGRKDSAQIAQPESVVGGVQHRAAPSAITPTTTQGNADGPQASQAQQAATQPTQAGAAPAAKPAPELASAPAPAGAPEVRALSNGTPAANLGAQAAPAAGAQGAAPSAAPAAGDRPKNWRTSMLGAKPVAKALGIDTKGKRLAQVVAEIDARDTQAPATPEPAPTPGPARLGRDNTPLSEGGKPFKTRKAAGDAKKLQPMMRVVTVPGGYALAEKTPAQLAAEERASRRLRNPNTSARGEPIPAHAFIAASGGLHLRHRNDLGVDGNPRIGNRRLFGGLNGGLSIEQATEMLVADGYLSEGASHNDAYALIKKSLSQPQYNADGIERIAQAESDAQFDDYLAAQEEAAADGDTDPFGMADEFTAEELDEVGYTDADPALQAEVSALIAQAEAMDIDTFAILEDIARTYANATQDQYNAAAREALASAIARGNQDGGSTAAQAAPAAEPAAAQGLNRPAALTSQARTATESVAQTVSTTVEMPPTRQQVSSPFARLATGRYRIAIRDEGNGQYAEVVAIQRGSGVEIEMRMPGEALEHPAFSQLNARVQALFATPTASMFDAEPATLELAAQTPAEAAASQEQAEQAEKAQAAAKRAADAAVKAEDERKRIAQASVRAADSFELGQDPMDSLTGQGGLMFSRTGAKSPNAQQPTARAWYDRFVSLLPASYRNDSHRREPLPTEDWNVQRSAEVREKIDALNKQLRGANDRKGYGPVSADGLGNLQVDARSVSAADLSGPIRALADELGAGVAATNVRSGDVRALLGEGFVSETSLAAIADRLMGRPFAQPVNTYTKDSAPGTILTYKPRGFPAALFARSATPPADSNERNVATQLLVDGLTENWTRAPEIIVARNMQDPQVPQAVRDYDETLKSQGATGEARGFIYKGKVYLLSDELKGPEQIAEVLFHEVLGHYGLRGAFGESLTPILQQMGTMRRRDVVAKAREYGLFDKDALGGLDKTTASDAQIWAAMSAKDRLSAAEEVLAEMAQTQPTIGFVQRAIAAIRNWLRANVPGFKSLRLTDADIVQAYILPARGFVTRSKETGAQSLERAMAAFSRGKTSAVKNKNAPTSDTPDAFAGRPNNGMQERAVRAVSGSPELAQLTEAGSDAHLSTLRAVDVFGDGRRIEYYDDARGIMYSMQKYPRGERWTAWDVLPASEGGSQVIGEFDKHHSFADAVKSIRGARISASARTRLSKYGAIPNTWDGDAKKLAKALIDAGVSIHHFANSTQSRSKYIYLDDGRKIRLADHDLPSAYDAPDYDYRYGVGNIAQLVEQVTTSNNGTFDPANPDIRFSRAATTVAADYTPTQQAAAEKAFGSITKQTFAERAQAFRANLGTKLRQGLVDQFAPIKEVSQHAYMLARMSKGSDGAVEAALLYGKPYLRDGVTDVNMQDGGFANVLASLKGEHDRFFQWVAAQRAERLKADDKENLLTNTDITALRSLNAGKMADGTVRMPLYAKALQELNAFNEASLKVALESGLIDQAAYDLMRDQPYVPFYRLMEDGDMRGPRFSSGLTNQQAWKKLKGGTQQLNADLLQNTLLNWSHLYAAAARNRAALATMTEAENLGIAYQVPADTKGAAKVMRNGVAEHWMVEDPYLLEAISALNYTPGGIVKALAPFKRLLTFGVTVNPAFKIRNLIRDSLSAIAQTDLSYNPAENVAKGWKATSKSSQTYASMLASGGIIKFGTQENTNHLRGQIERLGGTMLDKQGWDKLTGQMRSLWETYEEFGDRTENVNRAALYERLRAKGLSHAEASFQARDLMDFSMSGKWEMVRFLTQTVPFLNARLQGLYKLGRSAKEDPRRFAAMAAAVSMASLALLAAYSDDEDWKKREDWDRDNFWWFKVGGMAFRIPKPFEVGAIGTVAERTAELMFSKEMTGKRFGQRISDMVFNTFAMDPTPQAIKPFLDVYANKDSFSGRAIEGMADERLRPQDRYNERTSEVARLLGSWGLPDPVRLAKGEYAGLSPKQIDFLLRGYFGWLATVSTTATDVVAKPLLGRGERPEAKLRDAFLAGNFVESLPSGSSRYVTAMYEQARDVEQAWASYQAAIKSGDIEKAREIQQDEAPKLRSRMAVENAKSQISDLNARAKRIESDKFMSAQAKRAKLDEIETLRNRVAERVAVRN